MQAYPDDAGIQDAARYNEALHRTLAKRAILPLMSNDLSFTGERFVPGDPAAIGEMWTEHWHRYHFVLAWVSGKRVLDVACGEGYGSALMARSAEAVTGVDIAPDAIAHARQCYGALQNLRFTEASCTTLPFEDASFDCIVSFETLEHIPEQARFLAEIRRVLTPDGICVVSTPNKEEYSDKRGYANAFHVKELYRAEFEQLLTGQFAHRRWFAQRNAFVSMIEGEDGTAIGESMVVAKVAPESKAPGLPALYYVVAAANNASALDALPTRLSIFCDAEEWVMNDYRACYRGLQHYHQRTLALEAELATLRDASKVPGDPPSVAETTNAQPKSGPQDSAIARFIKKLSN